MATSQIANLMGIADVDVERWVRRLLYADARLHRRAHRAGLGRRYRRRLSWPAARGHIAVKLLLLDDAMRVAGPPGAASAAGLVRAPGQCCPQG